MRICHVTSAHKRYDVRIFEKECSSLAKKGYEVYLIVNDTEPDEIKNDVHICSTGFQPLGRKERMFDSMARVYEKIKEINADVYHFHDPELLQLVNKVCKLNKKIIFDAHEDTGLQIMDKDWIIYPLRKIVSVLYEVYAKARISKCTAVVTVTPSIVKKMERYSGRVVMITNYPILGEFQVPRTQKEGPYIFFAGGIDPQWCQKEIIEAVESIDNLSYLFAGIGNQEYIDSLIRGRSTEKIKCLGRIKHEEVGQIYQKAVAGVAINKATQIKGEGTLGNTKLFEIMAAGIPVICTDYKLWAEIIDTYECGICVNPDCIEDITDALKWILTNPAEAEEMGLRGRKAVEEQFNWSVEEKKLLALYAQI